MTCRQVIAARPALEADKQWLPRVQHDEQPLSAGEPSVLGLRLKLARQSADSLLFSSSEGYRRLIKTGRRPESGRSRSASFWKLLPSYSQALLTINFADKRLAGGVWPQFEPVGEASTMIEWTKVDGVDGVDKLAGSGDSLWGERLTA
jgi:hypothetical protein